MTRDVNKTLQSETATFDRNSEMRPRPSEIFSDRALQFWVRDVIKDVTYKYLYVFFMAATTMTNSHTYFFTT